LLPGDNERHDGFAPGGERHRFEIRHLVSPALLLRREQRVNLRGGGPFAVASGKRRFAIEPALELRYRQHQGDRLGGGDHRLAHGTPRSHLCPAAQLPGSQLRERDGRLLAGSAHQQPRLALHEDGDLDFGVFGSCDGLSHAVAAQLAPGDEPFEDRGVQPVEGGHL
jgi:hypothetical protein